jgi:hypothetical protein
MQAAPITTKLTAAEKQSKEQTHARVDVACTGSKLWSGTHASFASPSRLNDVSPMGMATP